MNNLEKMEHMISELQTKLDNVLYMSVPQRIACELKKLCANEKLDPVEFRLPVTKGTLALRIGITHETLSRHLKRLSHIGAVIIGRNVAIDSQRLKKAVCDNCIGQKLCTASDYGAKKEPA